MAGAVVLFAVVVIAALSPVLAPYPPNQIDISHRLQPPGSGHALGTDNLGRDVFSRLLYGARPYVQAGLVTTGIATVVGLLLGFASAGIGGRTDSILRRAVLAVALVAGLLCLSGILPFGFLPSLAALVGPPGFVTVVIPVLLSFVFLPRVYDLARQACASAGIARRTPDAQPRQNRTFSFRDLARSVGPLAPLTVVNLGMAVGIALLAIASPSYLGLGVPPPTPDWGNMLSSFGPRDLDEAPWILASPGVAMALTTLGAILFGVALREIWVPRFSALFGRGEP